MLTRSAGLGQGSAGMTLVPSLPQGFPSDSNPTPAQPCSTHCEHWNTHLLPQGSLISTSWVFGSRPTHISPSPGWASKNGCYLGGRDSEGVCGAWVHRLLRHQIDISWAVTRP